MARITVFAITFFIGFNAFASDLFELGKPAKPKQQIQTSLNGTMVSFKVVGKSHGGIISVSGPNGFYVNETFDGTSKTINLLEKFDKLPPGQYSYQISAHVGPLKLVRDTINNGRGDDNFTYAGTPVEYSGSFIVKSGSIQQFRQLREPATNEW